jgi:hypothetical protein
MNGREEPESGLRLTANERQRTLARWLWPSRLGDGEKLKDNAKARGGLRIVGFNPMRDAISEKLVSPPPARAVKRRLYEA